MISASEALARLREGNRRFVSGSALREMADENSRRLELLNDQAPFAIVLGCSDSRVPAEIVFDQGLGDLFVIRVAGNIVAPSQIGSIEFAAERFGVRLVVVLGHSGCGAVIAALEELKRPTEIRSPNLKFIVSAVKNSVEHLLEPELLEHGVCADYDELLQKAVRENIRNSVEQLWCGSEILERLRTDKDLVVVAAEYDLKTGTVDFFD